MLKLATVLQSKMVIQQGKPFHLWGTCAPFKTVAANVDWTNETSTTKSDATGKWLLHISVPKVQPGEFKPHFIIIQDDETEIVLTDLLIGEVWIAGGQSNMQFKMICEENKENGVLNFMEEITNANFPEIRLFYVDLNFKSTPFDEVSGEWVNCNPYTVARFSGIAYFFSRELFLTLSVPVGIILTTIGASSAEAWVSREVLDGDESLYNNYLKAFDQSDTSKEELDNGFTWEKVTRPTLLYNAMIHPLFNLSIRGFIWYNGELNRNDNGLYTKLLNDMVVDWRKKFSQGHFPFLIVQQAPYRWENNDDESYDYAIFREAQADFRKLINTEMAILMDETDVSKLHPRNKQIAAKRLANIALNLTYNLKHIHYLGPQVKKLKIVGSTVNISYKNKTIVSGLTTSDKLPPRQFFIAGNDRQFYEAEATIIKNATEIRLTCPNVEHPISVRYAFTNTAVTNLTNSERLPAEPFRTDNWLKPKIISISNIKGGSGKSTLALNIWDYLKDIHNCVLIDAGLNGSLTDLKKHHPEINILNEIEADKIKRLPFDVIIIDTPAYFLGLEKILQISDFVLIPTESNPFDAMAINHIAEFVRLVQCRFMLKSGVVMNKVIKLDRSTLEVYDYLKSLPIRLMDTIVHKRASLARSPITGGIFSTGDKVSKNELATLSNEIMKIIDL